MMSISSTDQSLDCQLQPMGKPATPLRLLMVEDSKTDAELILQALCQAGFAPTWQCVKTEAEYITCLEAISSCSYNHQCLYDVILSDYNLSQFNVLRGLYLLRQTKLDLPFIIVTNAISEEVAITCMKQGATDYLLKDRLARLGPAIRSALQAKQLRGEKQLALEALRESEARFRRLAENAPDIIYRYRVAAPSGFEYISSAVTALLGYTPGEYYANPESGFQVVCPELQGTEVGEDRTSATTPAKPVIVSALSKNGTIVWMEQRNVPVYNEKGQLMAIEGIARDVTERKLVEEQLRYTAFFDQLTGLPNRTLFLERLRGAIERRKGRWADRQRSQGGARAPANRGGPPGVSSKSIFAVLLLDLKRFQMVKYSLGHPVADQLLSAAAHKLQRCLRSGDLVARVGTDEFAILLADVKDISEAVAIAEQLHDRLQEPFVLNGREIFTTASIGIAPGSLCYGEPADYLRAADTAMHHAKLYGSLAVFDRAMQAKAMAKLQLDADLRRALERQEFLLHYQPIVSLSTGKIAGFEALLRWQHPERGLVSPGEFIPVAEEIGLIGQMGEWVIWEACRQMRGWQVQFPHQHLAMGVNLSGIQFAQAGLSDRIGEILRETGLDGSRLKLEVTESAIVETAESASAILKKLRALGIQTCIDDFGTGYSSLSRLHELPIDTLKIDRSFVSRIGTEGEGWEIVRTIGMLASKLGMEVVAEGVETAEQLSVLRNLQCSCHYGQGYFFSRPVGSEAATMLLTTQSQW
ncbi:MAG: EAL domain-containing protein [Actinomycetota bacterium]